MTNHSKAIAAQKSSNLPSLQEALAFAPHRRNFVKGAIGTAAGAAMLNSVLGTVTAQDEAQEPVHGGHLNIAILRDPITLDPHVSSGTTSHTFQAYVYDNLTDYGPEGELTPSLAESWDISEDGLTYVFNLRRGIMFHHGGEFVADDVVYSIERMKDPEVNATLAPQVELIASCEAIDDYTVEMTLSAPYAPILDVLANWTAGIVSKEYSEGGVDYAVTMNGTGPYKQDEFDTNIRYRFVINEQYWKEGLPYIETIEQRAIQDDTARVAALQAGDVDIATYTPWPFFNSLEEDPNFNLFMNNSVYNFVRFNHQVAPLDDPRVRQALSYALDRDAIRSIAFGGHGQTITGGLMPSTSFWYNEDLEGTFTYDPERALALLAEAGYSDPSEIQLNIRASVTAAVFDSAEVVAQQLRDLGIQITLESMDSPTVAERRATGDYQVMVDGKSVEWEDPDIYSIYFETDAPGHAQGAGYSNEELNQLLVAGRSTVDPDERKAIYREVEGLLLEDLPVTYLFYRPQAETVRSYVNGYTTIPNLGARSESYPEHLWLADRD